MVLVEFRIPLPTTCEEFKRGQLYSIIDLSLKNSGGGEGVEWIKNEEYDNLDGHLPVSDITKTLPPKTKGFYTLKKYISRFIPCRYHFSSRVPGFVKMFLPSDALYLIEESWHAPPHTVTVLVNGYLSIDKFKIICETWIADDKGEQENALNLTPEQLKKRQVIFLDFSENCNEKIVEEDVTKWQSKTREGYGPFTKGWLDNFKGPTMCSYKLCDIKAEYWGIQTKTEKMVLDYQKSLFLSTMRRVITLSDEYIDKTFEEVRELEKKTNAELEEKRLHGSFANTLDVPKEE